MIVVDTNVIAYLLLPGEHTEAARATLARDPAWAAPPLWRSEMRSVLALQVRRKHLETLRLPLVTSDRPLIGSFPEIAVALENFAAE